MNEPKTDLRIVRTRKLIMESFITLSEKKEFKDITIKDITAEAMINRTTFYYHFEDIYDLLEKVLSEVLLINLAHENYDHYDVNEEAFVALFTAITNFQKTLATRCHRGYEDTIARIIKNQLEIIFYKMLVKQHHVQEDDALKVTAVILSWGIYGASVEWRRTGQHLAPEQFIKDAIPYLLGGVKNSVRE